MADLVVIRPGEDASSKLLVQFFGGWRCGLVVDTRLWDQGVPSSSLGCAGSTLSLSERFCTYISSLPPPPSLIVQNEYLAIGSE